MIDQQEWKNICKHSAKAHFKLGWQAWKARNHVWTEDSPQPTLSLAIKLWGGTEDAQSDPACPSCGSLIGYTEFPVVIDWSSGLGHPAPRCFECGYGAPWGQGTMEKWLEYSKAEEQRRLFEFASQYAEGTLDPEMVYDEDLGDYR